MQFTPEMQSRYMRIPFTPHGRNYDGCDCGGLVWLVYKDELGIELPDWRKLYEGTTIQHSLELEEAVSTMLGENGIEVPFSEIRPFDVVAFEIAGEPIHVGLAVNSKVFLHIMQGRTRACCERFDSFQWRKRISGCYRHAEMFSK